MDDGYEIIEESDQGYDIGPDEVYAHLAPEFGSREVQMIRNVTQGPDGMQIEYETVTVEPYRRNAYQPTNFGFEAASTDYYFSEKHRLESFTSDKWNDSFVVTKEDLAKNGFFYAGPNDRVQCVFCNNYLSGWEPGDTVEGEHQNHFPDCPFVKGGCLHLNKPLSKGDEIQRTMHVRMRTSNGATYPEYADYTSRLQSFRDWRFSHVVRPESLAKAGFFYSTHSAHPDSVKCFQCGLSMSQWEKGDDPIEEHFQSAPTCEFAKEIRMKQNQLQNNSHVTNGHHHHNGIPMIQSEQCTEPSNNNDQLNRDLTSPAAQAILENEELSQDELCKVLTNLRLRIGSEARITSEDIFDTIDTLQLK